MLLIDVEFYSNVVTTCIHITMNSLPLEIKTAPIPELLNFNSYLIHSHFDCTAN